ncbi:MAG: ATP-binding cassette domain-containing protein [Candidatus Lokiarchaeota archaeon]
MNALFKVENLRKEFKLKDGSVQEVLSNIKFSVGKGECFTLIGPNGSGKTTLLRILDLLEKPTEGKIYYKGRELTSLTQVEKVSLRRKFAFLRQKPVVLNTSVYNNISYGLKVRGYSDEEIKKRTNRIIELIGLKGLEV